MGCKWSKEKYVSEIVKLSNKTEQEVKYMIEQIIINTNFKESDIYYLYDKFSRLEANKEGFISNSQLLELPEFKYCPFKKHLLRVFKLELKNEIEESEFNANPPESINHVMIDDEKHEKLTINNNNNNFIKSFDKGKNHQTLSVGKES